MVRARMSDVPPGGYGTMMRTGFCGQACASTRQRTMRRRASAIDARQSVLASMVSSGMAAAASNARGPRSDDGNRLGAHAAARDAVSPRSRARLVECPDRKGGRSPRPSSRRRSTETLQPLEHRRDALAAADAHRDQRVAAAGALQLVHRLDREDRAGRADRMAERDRAAVRVGLLRSRGRAPSTRPSPARRTLRSIR